jgi:hypothetical protein
MHNCIKIASSGRSSNTSITKQITLANQCCGALLVRSGHCYALVCTACLDMQHMLMLQALQECASMFTVAALE